MKKMYLLAALLCGFLSVQVMAGDERNHPVAKSGTPLGVDYGGVDIWSPNVGGTLLSVTTVALPINGQNPSGTYGFYASTTVPNNKSRWLVYGALFSTATCAADFIEVQSATGGYVSATSSVSQPTVLRIFNVSNSTVVANGGTGICSGLTPLLYPVRFYGNLYMRTSNLTTQYPVQLLYYKEPD